MLVIEKTGYGEYKNSLLSYQFFRTLKTIIKKKVFYKTNKHPSKEGQGVGKSIGQKKMLNCSAGPTEPWPAHWGGSGDSIAHLYVWPLSCCLPQSLDSDCARKAQSRARWSWPWRSWQQETIYQPRSLQLGGKSLLDGDLGGASPCPPHQHCVPQGTSVIGMETCRSCCRRCSHSDTWKGTSRRDPSEDAWGTPYQSLLPPQSHGVSARGKNFQELY